MKRLLVILGGLVFFFLIPSVVSAATSDSSGHGLDPAVLIGVAVMLVVA
jgi:hypothetical protein